MGNPVYNVLQGKRTIGPPNPVYLTNLDELCASLNYGLGTIPLFWGTPYYVAHDGDDGNDGLTKDTPFKTLNYTESVVQPGDVVFVKGPGTYPEVDSLYGWQRAIDNVHFYAVGGPVTVVNPVDTYIGGRACRITANYSDIVGFRFSMGTIVPDNCVAVEFWGALQSHLIECVGFYGNNATHSALVFDNNALACGVWSRDVTRAAFFGPAGLNVGTAIKANTAFRCFMNEIGTGVSNIAVEFSGNANQCSIDDKSLVQDARIGINVLSGAQQCIYPVKFNDVEIPIVDNSGNATNNPKATPLHTEISLVAGPGTHNVTIFYVHGTVEIEEIYANITESPGIVTAVYLSLEDGSSTDITKSVGAPALTTLPVGSFIVKDGDTSVIIGVYDSSTPQIVESTGPRPAVAFDLVEESGGAATTLDLVFTTTGNATGTLEVHVVWKPKSDGSYISLA